MIAWGAQAQETQTEPDAAPPVDQMAPSAEEGAETTAPIVPETANPR